MVGTCVGAGDDEEVGVLPRGCGGADLVDHFFRVHHLPAQHVAAFLGRGLVLQLDGGNSSSLILPYGTHQIHHISETGVAIADNGNGHGRTHILGPLHHLAHGHQAHIRCAQLAGGLSVARHVHAGKARGFRQSGAERVVCARQDQDLLGVHQFSQSFSCLHTHSFL